MSFARALSFNRIGGQMTILILVSLLAIHAVITATIMLGQRHGWEAAREEPAAFVAAVRFVAAAAPTERPRLLADIGHAFPYLELGPAAAMPPAQDTSEHWLRFLRERLGPGFQLAMLPAAAEGTQRIAVRLPDGQVLTARLPPRLALPLWGGPLAITVLFVVLSVTLLGVWAARALRRPLADFARAAESFSLEGDVAALPERGPQEVRAVAKALNRMRERIRRLVDDRTRMLAAMGHDLRTPITRLRLRGEFIDDAELRGQMLRDLDQMRAMTDGVLSFLRDGQSREALTSIDLASDLQTICDQFTDTGYAVSYAGPAHAAVVGRPDELQRAVANLVDNAVRHGTSAVVRLSDTPQAYIIEVEDDGPGIPDESKQAMLEAFVRGEPARTMDERAGFGLGLSIARAVAEAHGGALTLHDRAPHGLIARITLPLAGQTPASSSNRAVG